MKNWIADLFAETYFSVIRPYGKKVYGWVVGIPMIAICTPLLEPCSGYCYESHFIANLS